MWLRAACVRVWFFVFLSATSCSGFVYVFGSGASGFVSVLALWLTAYRLCLRSLHALHEGYGFDYVQGSVIDTMHLVSNLVKNFLRLMKGERGHMQGTALRRAKAWYLTPAKRKTADARVAALRLPIYHSDVGRHPFARTGLFAVLLWDGSCLRFSACLRLCPETVNT